MAKNQAEADTYYWLYVSSRDKSKQLTDDKKEIDAQIALLEEAKASLTLQVKNLETLLQQEFPRLNEKTEHFKGSRRDEFNRVWGMGQTNLAAYKTDHEDNIATIAEKIKLLKETSDSLLRNITMTDAQTDWNYQQYLRYR